MSPPEKCGVIAYEVLKSFFSPNLHTSTSVNLLTKPSIRRKKLDGEENGQKRGGGFLVTKNLTLWKSGCPVFLSKKRPFRSLQIWVCDHTVFCVSNFLSRPKTFRVVEEISKSIRMLIASADSMIQALRYKTKIKRLQSVFFQFFRLNPLF